MDMSANEIEDLQLLIICFHCRFAYHSVWIDLMIGSRRRNANVSRMGKLDNYLLRCHHFYGSSHLPLLVFISTSST